MLRLISASVGSGLHFEQEGFRAYVSIIHPKVLLPQGISDTTASTSLCAEECNRFVPRV